MLAAIVVVAWLGRHPLEVPTTAQLPATDSAPAPAAAVQALPVTPATAPSPSVAALSQTASPVAASVTSSSEQLALLLLGASNDLAAVRLMSPPGQNAYEKYRQVLAMEAGNRAARQGLTVISQRYLALAYGEMDAGHLERAQTYVGNAAKAAPDNAALNPARDALAARRLGVAAPTAAPLRRGAPIIDRSTPASDRPR